MLADFTVTSVLLPLACTWQLTIHLTWCDNTKNYLPFYVVFTVRHYASAVGLYAIVRCLCVCLSVTLRYCIKTAKGKIMQITPHDSPRTLDFWCERSCEIRTDKCKWGGLNWPLSTKTCYNSKTVQDRRIVSIKVEYFHWMPMLLMTLGDL